MTYGQIGEIVGINPRQVGKILHQNPELANIPCHRVVNAKGETAANYAFGGAEIQKKQLKEERVVFSGARVDLRKYLYKGNH